MRDSNIRKLRKADTKENESGLLAKIHKADQFERLRGRSRRGNPPTPAP